MKILVRLVTMLYLCIVIPIRWAARTLDDVGAGTHQQLRAQGIHHDRVVVLMGVSVIVGCVLGGILVGVMKLTGGI